MRTLIIVGHPDYETSSSQQFLIQSVAHLENVEILYLSHPSSVSFEQYDRYILQFPIYWYQSPSLVKEWIDTVLVDNIDFFKSKELGLVVTLGASENHFQAGGREKFTISEMLRPFEMIANKLKMIYLPPKAIHQFDYLSEKEKWQLLVDYQYYVTRHAEHTFLNYGKWLQKRLKEQKKFDIFVDYMQKNIEELDELNQFGEMYDE